MNFSGLFKSDNIPSAESKSEGTQKSKLSVAGLFGKKNKNQQVAEKTTQNTQPESQKEPDASDLFKQDTDNTSANAVPLDESDNNNDFSDEDDLLDFDKSLKDLNDDSELNKSLDEELANENSGVPGSSVTVPKSSSATTTSGIDIPSLVSYSSNDMKESGEKFSKEAYDRLGQEADKYRRLYQQQKDELDKVRNDANEKVNKAQVTADALQESLSSARKKNLEDANASKEQIEALTRQLNQVKEDRDEASRKLGEALASLDDKKKIDDYRLNGVISEVESYKKYVLRKYQDKFGVIDDGQ